jgi:hypothetical protein
MVPCCAFTAATCVTVNPLTAVCNRSEMLPETRQADTRVGDIITKER